MAGTPPLPPAPTPQCYFVYAQAGEGQQTVLVWSGNNHDVFEAAIDNFSGGGWTVKDFGEYPCDQPVPPYVDQNPPPPPAPPPAPEPEPEPPDSGNPPIYIPPGAGGPISAGGGDGSTGDTELAEILLVLVEGFNLLNSDLKALISKQGNGEPGSSDCCTSIVAAIASVTSGLGLLTRAVIQISISGSGGAINFTPIVSALASVAAQFNGLPALIPLLVTYLESLSSGGAPVDLSEVIAQLKRIADQVQPDVNDSADADQLTAWVISQPAYPPEAAQALVAQASATAQAEPA
jgi:hypothetical protein